MPADQRRRARQAEEVQEDREPEQTEHDRRHRGEVVDVHLDQVRPAIPRRELLEIDRRGDADRKATARASRAASRTSPRRRPGRPRARARGCRRVRQEARGSNARSMRPLRASASSQPSLRVAELAVALGDLAPRRSAAYRSASSESSARTRALRPSSDGIGRTRVEQIVLGADASSSATSARFSVRPSRPGTFVGERCFSTAAVVRRGEAPRDRDRRRDRAAPGRDAMSSRTRCSKNARHRDRTTTLTSSSTNASTARADRGDAPSRGSAARRA